jgi:D-beta-D-heptose 7-phosphate kinase/D-beta-D-heptose 1-phosphate adenosyltransferase
MVLPLNRLVPLVRKLQKQRKKVAFTNGCFDILHIGHLDYLERIKKKADILIVAINSDSSVRKNKGPSRPVVPQKERARLLASLKPVDYVTIFSEPTPLRVIRALRPDWLAKGADWKGKLVVGQKEVEAYGGKVVLLPYIRNHSTTGLLARLKSL